MLARLIRDHWLLLRFTFALDEKVFLVDQVVFEIRLSGYHDKAPLGLRWDGRLEPLVVDCPLRP